MKYLKTFESMIDSEDRSIETIGAKIRNRLSPYSTLIEIAEDNPEYAIKLLNKRIDLHRKMLNDLEALSHECEIEPSEKWDKYGD